MINDTTAAGESLITLYINMTYNLQLVYVLH
jgi:hypothetical protein